MPFNVKCNAAWTLEGAFYLRLYNTYILATVFFLPAIAMYCWLSLFELLLWPSLLMVSTGIVMFSAKRPIITYNCFRKLCFHILYESIVF